MMIVKFLKNHTTLSIIILLTLVVACLFGYVSLVGNIMETFNIATKQVETVGKINAAILDIGKKIILYYQLGLAMLSFKNWIYLALFLLICSALLVFTVLIVKPYYFNTAMSNLENNVKLKQKPKHFKKCRPFISIIKKETACIFRSPSEIFEFFLFTLLMPFVVFSYDKLLMAISGNKAGMAMIAGSHIMVVAIMALLSNMISASAISREGETFYVSKITPVNYYTQIFAKLTFNIIFTSASLLLTMIVSFFIYPWWQVLLGTIAILFTSIGHAAMSIEMDIKNPSKNFQGDGKSSSVSKSTTKSIVYALLIGFLLGFTLILMASFKYIIVPYIIIIAFGLIFMLRKLFVLVLRINMQYEKIEM
jgi:ABC-2 type transport system permease protein